MIHGAIVDSATHVGQTFIRYRDITDFKTLRLIYKGSTIPDLGAIANVNDVSPDGMMSDATYTFDFTANLDQGYYRATMLRKRNFETRGVIETE